MHRELRNRLSTATGQSDLVVAIFLDVRGFSSFAGMAESSEAALFLRSAYTQILDDYYPDAAFFKPTGDGLMIIRHFGEDTLLETVETSIRTSIDLVQAFPTLTDRDPMVNFDVPGSLGIGVARGAATRLTSDGFTLDYSGRPLNLAARLMDVARPSGVVVDSRVLKGLQIPQDLQGTFRHEDIYVKGIADLKPIDVFCTPEVEIRTQNRRPMMGVPHQDSIAKLSLREFRERSSFAHRPEEEPLDPDAVRLRYWHPKVTSSGRRSPKLSTQATAEPIQVRRTTDGWQVVFDYTPLAEAMASRGVKSTWPISICLEYTVASH